MNENEIIMTDPAQEIAPEFALSSASSACLSAEESRFAMHLLDFASQMLLY